MDDSRIGDNDYKLENNYKLIITIPAMQFQGFSLPRRRPRG
jgi:hypothetical protein